MQNDTNSPMSQPKIIENVKTTFTQSHVSQSMNNTPTLNMTSPVTP